MRFGMYFNFVDNVGDNTNSSLETVALTTSADRMAFGLKDSATNDLPGFGAALFLGAVSFGPSAFVQNIGGTQASTTGFDLAGAGYHDTTLVGGTNTQSLGNHLQAPASSLGATGYNGFFAVKFVITNLGTASQSVAISSAFNAAVTGTDYSAQALRLDINNALYYTPVSVAWNDGAVARTIPDAIFIRMPFYSNRIRLSAIRAIRYAP